MLQFERIKVHYRKSGVGMPVILVHAGGSSSAQWQGICDVLSNRNRLLSIDLHGYGSTDSWLHDRNMRLDDESALVHALRNICGGPAHLVGHSYGGSISLRAAILHPESFSSLTLIEPNSFMLLKYAGEEEMFAELYDEAQFFLNAIRQGADDDALKRFVDYWNAEEGMWQSLPDHVRARLRSATQTIAGGLEALYNDPIRPSDCRELRIPTLLIHGQHTKEPLRRLIEVLANLLPNSTPQTIKGAKHMSPVTHPVQAAAAIQAHLERIFRLSVPSID